MPLTRLDSLLKDASKLLDDAAGEIRDAPLEPTRDHILHIGRLITGIFELQQVVWKHAPELMPDMLRAPNPYPGSSREFGDALLAAYAARDAGDWDGAREVLDSFLRTNPPDELRQQAESALQRLNSERKG